LWTLVYLSGKAEWTELRKLTKLTAAEPNAFSSELIKEARIDYTSGNSVTKQSRDPAEARINARFWSLSYVPSGISFYQKSS
jgi:hypothetical protein